MTQQLTAAIQRRKEAEEAVADTFFSVFPVGHRITWSGPQYRQTGKVIRHVNDQPGPHIVVEDRRTGKLTVLAPEATV